MNKLITILLIVLSITTFSQDKLTINGEEYYMHKVKKKETLYGISKQYNVTVDKIQAANPELINGLKKKQLIKIPVEKKVEVQPIIDDENSYTVKAGETAYGIAQKHNISIDELFAANVGKTTNLKPGDKLVIPIKKEIVIPEIKDDSSRIIAYTVKEGETAYAISRNHKTTVDEIKKLNKDIVITEIKPGDILKIRTTIIDLKVSPLIVKKGINHGKMEFTKVNNINPLKEKFEKMIMKDAYNMTLLLPFMLDKNASIQKNRKPNDPKRIYQLTEMSTHFYQGVKLALDTVKTAGVSINLNVYDTKKDTGNLNKLFKTEELLKSDVILGPLYENTYAKAVDFAKENKIQLICPVDQSNKSLFNNPYVTKLKASLPTQANYLASYLGNNHNTENVIVITGKSKKDKYLAETFTQVFNENIKTKTDNYKPEASAFKFVSYKDMSGIKGKLVASKRNIIVFPTTDLGLAASFFTQLNVEMNKPGMHKHEVSVFALENFLGKAYDNINVSHKIKYDLHVTSTRFIDYEGEKIKSFIVKYRTQFGTDPNEFAFMGYDAALYHAIGMNKFGKSFTSYYDLVKIPLLQSEYNLKRTDDNSGFENNKVYIISYKDYQLNKIN
jgi:LysM repeat protein/ABC-type branched-subunit amino acid transport system substrate-binding protein